jgi:ATP-dependent RNA helicase DeaD
MGYLPAERQTALFSATMPEPIARLARRHMQEPHRISLSRPEQLTAPKVEQFYYEVARPYKIEALTRLLDLKNPDLAVVFCATKRMVDDLAAELLGRGYRVEAIHGDLSQTQRERVIGAARAGRLDVLVATDVAARGIDIPEITHVVNFDLPQDPEYYVHRIGRTGRAGRAGEALTLVAPWESRELRVIERATGARLVRGEIPSIAELERREQQHLGRRLEQVIGSGEWTRYREAAAELLERHEPIEIAAAALTMIAGPVKPRADIPPPRPPRDRPFERGPRQGWQPAEAGSGGGPRGRAPAFRRQQHPAHPVRPGRDGKRPPKPFRKRWE